jgi:hypothetical protein
MASNPVFYQLLLIALVVICLLLHVGWLGDPRVVSQMSHKPATPCPKRSTEPKPFTGFLHTPLCEACEQRADARPQAPGAPLLC